MIIENLFIFAFIKSLFKSGILGANMKNETSTQDFPNL